MKRNGLLILMTIALAMTSCKKKGCIDPAATNYNPSADKDDGTCEYSSVASATTLDCQEFNQTGTNYQLVDLGLGIDYIVNCQMPVSCDLEIMPGVTIAFSSDAGLNVNSDGSIKAIATTSDPIAFTGVDNVAGSWSGIYIDSDDINNKIIGCKIEYAGGTPFNSNNDKGGIILWAASKAEVSNTTIQNCDSYGINSNYGGSDFTFSNNTITGCTQPMFTTAEYVGSISGGTFTGNAIDAIYVDTYASDGEIETSQTWTALGVPYRIKGGGILKSVSDWTIAPGVTVEFEPSVEVYIEDGNSLKAVGTSTDRITFRGVNSGQGAWERIHFNGTNLLNEIGFANISDGGENPTATKGTVYLWFEAKLNIHDVNFTDNAACAVYGKIFNGTSSNPNYTSSNLTFTNTPCTETFEY